jgi:hypothetical protein
MSVYRVVLGALSVVGAVVLVLVLMPASAPNIVATTCGVSFSELLTTAEQLNKVQHDLALQAKALHDKVLVHKSALDTTASALLARLGVEKPSTALELAVKAVERAPEEKPKRTFPGQPCRLLPLMKGIGCGSCGGYTCAPFPWEAPPCGGTLTEVYLQMMEYSTELGKALPMIYSYIMRGVQVFMLGGGRGHALVATMLAFPRTLVVVDEKVSDEVRALEQQYKSCAPTHKHLTITESGVPETMNPVDTLVVDSKYVDHTAWPKYATSVSIRIVLLGVNENGKVAKEFLKTNGDVWEEEAYFPFAGGLLVLRRKDPVCGGCYHNTNHHPEISPWHQR